MSGNLGEALAAAARAYPHDIAFEVRRGFRLDRLTYRESFELASRVGCWLATKGVGKGDRIAVWSPNMPEYAVLYLAAWLSGVVVVPIDIRTAADVRARFVAAARPRLGFRSRLLQGDVGPVPETVDLEDLFAVVATVPVPSELPDVAADALCEIAFTSGTTGVPKGVLLTHANLLASLAALRETFPLRRGHRTLSLLPLSHAFEQVITLLVGYTSGATVTYLPRVNAATVARAMRERRVTSLVIVPELLRIMYDALEQRVRREGGSARWTLAHRLAPRLPFALRRILFGSVHEALGGHLEFLAVGGAPLPPRLAEAWERMGIHVYEGYGLTETSAVTAINTPRAHRPGTAGRIVPGIEVRIADDGEILIRGAAVTSGYAGDPERTATALRDGWLRSGDVGFVDADGYLHVTGRVAFKIVLPSGMKVYAEDVEQALARSPLVRDACVVGVDRDGGEEVHAVLLTDAPERAAEIVREANRALSPHQRIASYTVWAEPDLPRTPILKVDRVRLRAAVARREARAPAGPTGAMGVADPLAAILARVARVSPETVWEESELDADLGLDSLGRVELLSALEEELGVAVDELRLGVDATVGELRGLVREGTAAETGPGARWMRSWWARTIRAPLLWLAFRLQDHWMRIEVVHPERAGRVPLPALLIFNYEASYVPLAILRALPPRIRRRTAIAADARLWQGRDRWQGLVVALGAQAFPFVKSGGSVGRSLVELGRWLDDGYAVVVSPEGNPETEEGTLLPFLGGTGLLAAEMRVPIVPFRIEGYFRLFPPEPPFPYLPVRSGRVRLVVGEPLVLPPGTSHSEATERARQALLGTC